MKRERFIIPDCDDCDVTLIDTVTGEHYTDNFSDIVAKMNELARELAICKGREIALREDSFTEMGGFTVERDHRGNYAIFSGNVVPKRSPVIKIMSPASHWNTVVKNLIWSIIGDDCE